MLTAAALAALAALVLRGAPRPSGRWRFDDWMAAAGERVAGWLTDVIHRPSRDLVPGLCAALAAELRAGAPPDAALREAAERYPVVPRGAAAARLGADVATALQRDAQRARSPALLGLAACWRVAGTTGAGLAEGVEQVAATALGEERVRQDLAAELAAPRATSRVLMLLPLVGLGLGELLGAAPIAWLLGSPAGRACLAIGVLLMAAGALWSHRMIATAVPAEAVG